MLVVEEGDFFFFKQKTAYEMRISDWSSDVALPICVFCADRTITGVSGSTPAPGSESMPSPSGSRTSVMISSARLSASQALRSTMPATDANRPHRSEERRVGQVFVSTCRSRWSPYHLKKQTIRICLHHHINII